MMKNEERPWEVSNVILQQELQEIISSIFVFFLFITFDFICLIYVL